jgi:hypothetical protein
MGMQIRPIDYTWCRYKRGWTDGGTSPFGLEKVVHEYNHYQCD